MFPRFDNYDNDHSDLKRKKRDDKIKIKSKRERKLEFFGLCSCSLPADPICYTSDKLPASWVEYPRTISGYRVNLGWKGSAQSILSSNHNEFYMIWSDLIPLVIYVILAMIHLSSTKFQNSSSNFKLLEFGIFFGIIISKFASSFYHVFNCVSLWTRQRLVNIDLIGITCMCFVTPYFLIIGDQSSMSADVVFTKDFVNYCIVLFAMQFLCSIVFFYNLIFGESSVAYLLRQPLLCILAALGNWAAVKIMISSTMSLSLRIHCGVSVICLLFGYVLCFMNQMPEVFFQKGVGDGKIWNSHVIWHGLLFIAHTSFIAVPLFY